ncbi:hypothetical protein L2E82_18412 [Cichorium intybus]|uniref:Uncharacterized protein n=1 Tax=Cichorium intybus TaxID=13427 RepID=A0ACB9FAR1_CICIN|nr:hypothetical protein L2E82_18412 [Cichorium intybus]
MGTNRMSTWGEKKKEWEELCFRTIQRGDDAITLEKKLEGVRFMGMTLAVNLSRYERRVHQYTKNITRRPEQPVNKNIPRNGLRDQRTFAEVHTMPYI